MRATADAVQRAEWRARVQLDDHVFARPAVAESTESQSAATRYMAYVLEGLGVTDPDTVEKVTAWRRELQPPGRCLDHARSTSARGDRARARSRSSSRRHLQLERVGAVGPRCRRRGGHLDFVLDSGEVGVEKPDRRIFDLALERAGIAAAEAAYIGDLYTIDVRGAGAAGLRPVLLDPGGFWGARDCAMAPDLLSAVRLVVG